MLITRHPICHRVAEFIFLTAVVLLFSYGAHAASVIKLASGPVVAAPGGELLILKGVPYAAAPLGLLRWQAPQPVAPWSQPRDAGDFGPSCPQTGAPRYVTPGTAAATTSEDCLFLNVWAPKPGGTPLPVVVWIHGGGNVAGTASQTFYDGSAFARDGVVFVSFNYRLGVLGFFAHPGLVAKGQSTAANFALLDQISALRWVQNNIRAVGGDPTNVTVMGESAGAEDILYLLSMPLAHGLFAKAIVQSAGMGGDSHSTLENAQLQGGAIATALGLKGVAATAVELRAAPLVAILEAQAHQELAPILDHTTLLAAPLSLIETREANHVPLIIGTNDNEAAEVLNNSEEPAAPAVLFPRLTTDDLATVRRLYGAAAADDAPFSRLLIRDGFFAAPARLVAAANSRMAATFLYRFDYVSSVFHGRRLGAAHGSEIPFVFQTGKSSQASPIDAQVSAQLHGYWLSFIRAGVPTYGDIVWPAYDAARDEAMVFAQHPRVMKTPEAAALDFLGSRLFAPVGR